MSLDRSLKMGSGLVRHRNVLTRAERIVAMQSAEKWPEGRSPLGLPKLANRKIVAAKKPTKAKAEPAAKEKGKGTKDAAKK